MQGIEQKFKRTRRKTLQGIEVSSMKQEHDAIQKEQEEILLKKIMCVMNKANVGDGIPVELFQILKDNAVKVLQSICQQIWKTQLWPQEWKRSVFIPIPKKTMPKNAQTTAQLHSSHTLEK